MKGWVIPVIAVLAIALVSVTYWGYQQNAARQRLEVAVANNYRQAFDGFMDHIENVQVKLAKSLVSNTLEQNLINLSGVWQEAAAAQASLARLPLSQETVMRAQKFLAQTGDYSYSLLRKNAMGVMLSEEEKEQLARLRQEADELGATLQNIQADVNDGKLSWTELHRTADPRVRRASHEIPKTGFDTVNEQLEDYPTLIYDGPFSDHVANMKPRGLTGSEISEEEAREKVLRFVPEDTAPRNPTAVKVREVRGNIPAWSFEIRDSRGEEAGPDQSHIVVDISKKGGHIISMNVNRDIGEKRLTTEQAVDRAQKFLESRGYRNMTATYVQYPDGIAVIPFAYTENDIVIYPDMIKVKVALDNGEILGFDALQYIMSHQERNLKKPEITEQEARQAVTASINIRDSGLAIIPLDNGKEAFCWEFKGQTKSGEPFIFYIDAMSGDVTKILKIIDNEEGITTM